MVEMSQCRACLEFGKSIIDMFTGTTETKAIDYKFIECAGIQMDKEDEFTRYICNKCLCELNIAYEFRIKCRNSDRLLRKKISSTESHIPKTDSIDDPHSDKNSVSDENDSICDSFIAKSNKIIGKTTKKISRSKKQTLKKSKHESVDDSRNNSKEKIQKRNHMCTECGKAFPFPNLLAAHERVHSGDKPFACKTCNRSFSQSGHLLVHERTHSGIKPYKCNFCPRAFTINHSLKKHLRTHTGERPYVCKICNKTFVTSYHLSNHHKRHAGDRTFKCDWQDCPHTFINMSEMKRHKMRHEKSARKKLSKAKDVDKSLHDNLISFPVSKLNFDEFPSRFLARSVAVEKQNSYNEFDPLVPLPVPDHAPINGIQDMSMMSFNRHAKYILPN